MLKSNTAFEKEKSINVFRAINVPSFTNNFSILMWTYISGMIPKRSEACKELYAIEDTLR
jgi:hypothetical protein